MQILKEFKILNEKLDQRIKEDNIIGSKTYMEIGKWFSKVNG